MRGFVAAGACFPLRNIKNREHRLLTLTGQVAVFSSLSGDAEVSIFLTGRGECQEIHRYEWVRVIICVSIYANITGRAGVRE